MTDQPAQQPAADLRPLFLQQVRESAQHKAEAVRLQAQVFALSDENTRLKAQMARLTEAHTAALTDRDLAHSGHVERLQAEIGRHRQSSIDQGKQSLENEAAAHEHARRARADLATHIAAASSPKLPALAAAVTDATEKPETT